MRAARGCDDWCNTRRSGLGRAAGQIIPLPTAAMDDGLLETARDGGLTRRDIMERGIGMFLMLSAGLSLSPRQVLEAAAAQQSANPNGPILVSVYLDGGNDGLNTLVPLADPRYRELRTRVGIASNTTIPLKGVTDFGWHPSLKGLSTLYDAGKVAVLPSVDFANPDQSHFNSLAYWRAGVVGPNLDRSGWMGRTLDVIGTPDNPLQGISVSYGLDPILQTKSAPVGTVYDPGGFSFNIPGVWEEKAFTAAYRETSQGARGAALVAAQKSYNNAFDMVELLRPLRTNGDTPPPPTPAAYPDSNMGNGLKNLARMLGGGFGTRLAAISAGGGYDTHDDQPAKHAELLTDLSDSMFAWQADLDARGLSDRVITLVWSEFGRRPEDNEGNGTDHGAGGLVLVVGNKANGGIQSEFPGLASLDEDENLKVSTEFRTVYASLLEGWMGMDAAQILPGIDAARLPLIR